ncbi:MAG: hypothetical protein AB7G13_08520 [Lautropia sp.]
MARCGFIGPTAGSRAWLIGLLLPVLLGMSFAALGHRVEHAPGLARFTRHVVAATRGNCDAVDQPAAGADCGSDHVAGGAQCRLFDQSLATAPLPAGHRYAPPPPAVACAEPAPRIAPTTGDRSDFSPVIARASP